VLDRSSFLRVALVTAALASALVLATTAHAAGARVTVPRSAPVVAGPTADGVRVRGFLHGTQLCLVVEVADPSTTPAGWISGDPTCDATPVLPAFGQGSSGSMQLPTREHDDAEVGVVGPEVAAVEWRRRGQTLARAETRPSPLPGAAADVRVYLLVHRGAERRFAPDETAFLDAAGTVRSAFDGEGLDDATPSTPRHVLQRGRRGSTPWTLRSWIARPLAGTLLDPERRVPVTCLGFGTGEGEQSTCDTESALPATIVPLISQEQCGATGLTVGGIVAAPVRRLVVVLGDGSRRAVQLRAVPGAPGGARAGVAVLGHGVALRRMVAVGPTGRVVDAIAFDVAPVMRAGCRRDGSFGEISSYSSGGAATPLPVLRAGAHTPVVEDDGPRVCLAIDRRPRPPADCSVPGTDVHGYRLDRYRTAHGGTYLAGLVPTELAAARLELDDGTTLEAPAAPVPGYQGRYAGVLQLIAVQLPPRRKILGASFLDARGRTLSNHATLIDGLPPRHVTSLLRTPKLPPVTAALLPGSGDFPAFPCVTLGPVRGLAIAGCSFSPGTLSAVALCSPRRIVVYGLVANRSDRVAVRLADGREVRGRTAALPAAIAPGAGAALVVLGPHDAPRELIVRGRAPYRQDLVLPPAAAQCGYSDVLWRNGF
jgi:hypothetical protein